MGRHGETSNDKQEYGFHQTRVPHFCRRFLVRTSKDSGATNRATGTPGVPSLRPERAGDGQCLRRGAHARVPGAFTGCLSTPVPGISVTAPPPPESPNGAAAAGPLMDGRRRPATA